MTCRELIAYLQQFEPERAVSVVVVNLAKRIHYRATGYELLDDPEQPAILLEVTGEKSFDEEFEKAMEEAVEEGLAAALAEALAEVAAPEAEDKKQITKHPKPGGGTSCHSPKLPRDEALELIGRVNGVMHEFGITQRRLARECGLGESIVNTLLRGAKIMRQNHADKLEAWLAGIEERIAEDSVPVTTLTTDDAAKYILGEG